MSTGSRGGGVRDALTVMICHRDGHTSMASLPYRIEDDKPVWLDGDVYDNGTDASAEISGRMTRIMEPTGMLEMLPEETTVSDSTMTGFLTGIGAVVLASD
jgi:hypothetical protein